MAEPSQQHLAKELEQEWIRLFNESHRTGKRPGAALADAIDIFLVEVETLFYLVAYEKRSLAGARRSLALRRYQPALVAVHPLINARIRESLL